MLEERLSRIVTANEIQYGLMPEKESIDTVLILRRMQEECHAKGKLLYICFVDIKKAFDREPRKVMDWAMRKTKYQKFWLYQ